MIIFKTQEEIGEKIKNGLLSIDDDVSFECSFTIDASISVAGDITAWNIVARDINARDINAGDINAWNIDAWNITTRDINAEDINAWNIDAGDITAWNIVARDIDARDITARDIDAGDIIYYAFCTSYMGIKCTAWTATRKKSYPPICLDGELIIKKEAKNDTN